MASVLVVDHESETRSLLAGRLRTLADDVEIAADGKTALEILGRKRCDVVFAGLGMADTDVPSLLREIGDRWPEVVVVIVTPQTAAPQAVAAMRAGAYDCLAAPFSPEDVDGLVDRVLEVRRLRRENRVLRSTLGQPDLLETASPKMRLAIETARQAAKSDAAVLLIGESGAGKGMFAAAIHCWSARASRPFVIVPCATLGADVFESGRLRQADDPSALAWAKMIEWLEAAASGTLFLDGIADLTVALQAEVLRLLDEEHLGSGRNAEARIVAAARQDLQAEVAHGGFRDDLFYRLSVVTIEVPPLRERIEDLSMLARQVLAMHAARHERPTPKLEREAEAALARHRWPGNVRELVNVLEHALIVCRGDEIRVGDLPERFRASSPSENLRREAIGDPKLPLTSVERRHIERVLAESPTLEKAAERLGISPTTLWRKRKRYGIEIETLLRPQSRG